MIVKLFWYLSSCIVILLILITNPSKNSIRSSASQNNLLNVSSSQVFVKKITSIFVLFFLILSIILSVRL